MIQKRTLALFAMIFGLFLGEIPSFYQITGGVLIALAGMIGVKK